MALSLKGRMKASVTSGESENLKSVKKPHLWAEFCANEKVPALNQWLIQLPWPPPVIKISDGFEKGKVSEGEMVFRTQASSIDH